MRRGTRRRSRQRSRRCVGACARRRGSSSSSARLSCATGCASWRPGCTVRRSPRANRLDSGARGRQRSPTARGRVRNSERPMSSEDAPTESPPRTLEERLATVPPKPGVYLLKDRAGKVIYVGKAKSLRARVASYFRGGDGRSQVAFLVQRVGDVECLVTQNEKEALILENNLIKQYKPRYNVRLKDDKSYVSVKITNHAWPRVVVTRRIVKDGGRYFGPFHSASAIRDTLDVIRKVFPLRTCSDAVFRNRTRPCLEYQIKRCLGPCVLPVDRAEYGQHLRAVEMMLEGRDSQLRQLLAERMAEASQA